MSPITGTAEWRGLVAHHTDVRDRHLRDLFADDPDRATRLCVEAEGIVLDLTKNRVTEETVRLLVAVAHRAGLRERIDRMFAGAHVNVTEDRPALHVALRAPAGTSITVDGADVVPGVHAVLDRMAAIADQIRDGSRRGHTGRPIRNVVNIGIGGSDLGPAMAYDALRAYSRRDLAFRFVSNVDGADLHEALLGLDPAETLFVVSSKSFSTVETLTNTRRARAWLAASGAEQAAMGRHFVAVSSNLDAVAEFGVDAADTFEMWDWVGGRYSVDSAIGLSLMIAIGPDRFTEMLAGFRSIDEHLRTAPFERNIPVLLGLLGVWYTDLFGAETRAVLPYSHYLGRFPAYLQQLVMESNGKSVSTDGSPVSLATGPVLWGGAGTNGQHAFHQLLHQGTQLVPCDFIGFLHPVGADDAMLSHDLLFASLLAQTEALAFGRTREEVEAAGVATAQIPHRTFRGNQPTTAIVLERLTPFTLGQLVAIYEHAVFTQATVWDIDPFDQWGVELGKELATRIVPELTASQRLTHDPATNALIERYRGSRPQDG